jgi:hypothetical protein
MSHRGQAKEFHHEEHEEDEERIQRLFFPSFVVFVVFVVHVLQACTSTLPVIDSVFVVPIQSLISLLAR